MSVSVLDHALLTTARAVANERDAFAIAGDRAASLITEVDGATFASARANIDPRSAKGARTKLATRARAQSTFTKREGERDCVRRRQLVVHRSHATHEVARDEVAWQGKPIASREECTHVLDVIEIRCGHMRLWGYGRRSGGSSIRSGMSQLAARRRCHNHHRRDAKRSEKMGGIAAAKKHEGFRLRIDGLLGLAIRRHVPLAQECPLPVFLFGRSSG
jgi:hypothetical protein